jgi:DNA-directed RNA polymerase subunit beta'
LESIIYYERYVVVQPGIKETRRYFNKMDLIDRRRVPGDPGYAYRLENQMLGEEDPNKFIAKMGADAVRDLLMRLDLDQLSLRSTSPGELTETSATTEVRGFKASAGSRSIPGCV